MTSTIIEPTITETTEAVSPATASGNNSDSPRCPRCHRIINMSKAIGGSFLHTAKIRCCVKCATPEEMARMERNLRIVIKRGNAKDATVDLLNLKAASEKYRGGH